MRALSIRIGGDSVCIRVLVINMTIDTLRSLIEFGMSRAKCMSEADTARGADLTRDSLRPQHMAFGMAIYYLHWVILGGSRQFEGERVWYCLSVELQRYDGKDQGGPCCLSPIVSIPSVSGTPCCDMRVDAKSVPSLLLHASHAYLGQPSTLNHAPMGIPPSFPGESGITRASCRSGCLSTCLAAQRRGTTP